MSLSRTIARRIDRTDQQFAILFASGTLLKSQHRGLALAGNTGRGVRRMARKLYNKQLAKYNAQPVELTECRRVRLAHLRKADEATLLNTFEETEFGHVSLAYLRDAYAKLVKKPTKAMLRKTELHLAKLSAGVKGA